MASSKQREVTILVRYEFKQDAYILKLQGENLRRFGGEHYASTAIDVLGLQIARLLRRAEGDAPAEESPEEWSREIELDV